MMSESSPISSSVLMGEVTRVDFVLRDTGVASIGESLCGVLRDVEEDAVMVGSGVSAVVVVAGDPLPFDEDCTCWMA